MRGGPRAIHALNSQYDARLDTPMKLVKEIKEGDGGGEDGDNGLWDDVD